MGIAERIISQISIVHLEFILRIVLAALCGAVIGYERNMRGKGAGIRTHMVVSLASALMMIISKYGFADLPVGEMGMRGADSARIAAQVVSGVGFLGAGTIYFNRNVVKGLTTAAGIWATAGIGLAIGSGMYVVGIASVFIMLIFQFLLHKNISFLNLSSEEQISIIIDDSSEAIDSVRELFASYDIHMDNVKYEKDDGKIRLTVNATIPQNTDISEILGKAQENRYIRMLNI